MSPRPDTVLGAEDTEVTMTIPFWMEPLSMSQRGVSGSKEDIQGAWGEYSRGTQ